MSRPTALKSRLLAFAPWVFGGLVVGLLVLVVWPSVKWIDTPPRAEPDPADASMMRLPGGYFDMGSDDGPADERPAHMVILRPFSIDITEVTNEQFARFVDATGYTTVAERLNSSAVFVPIPASLDSRDWVAGHPPWWELRDGATWRHPDGPGSDITAKQNHPVVHIAWEDAEAFAWWAGKRLPTEAEWEYAARGGLNGQEYCWGSQPQGAGGQVSGEHLPGHVSARRQRGGRVRRHGPGGEFPAERVRAVRHERQRVGVVRRLVSARLLPLQPEEQPDRPDAG